MSGMIMLRRENGIELLSDGGFFRSTSDFSITGLASKPIVLPHLSAVISLGGTAELNFLLRANQQNRWSTFDHLLFMIEDGIRREVETLFQFQPDRDRVDAMLQIGGYSPARSQWESRMLVVKAPRGEDPEITWLDDSWLLFAPVPTKEAFEQCGFDPKKPIVHSLADAFRFMKAMRSSKYHMGNIGDDADTAPTGSTIAGFVELVTVTHHQAVSQILWRWPDDIGKMVDPAAEGEPTAIYRRLFEGSEAA